MKLNIQTKSNNIDFNNLPTSAISDKPPITTQPWYMQDIYELSNRFNPNKPEVINLSPASSNNDILHESKVVKVNNNNKTKQQDVKNKYNNLSPFELKKRIKKIDQEINDLIIKDKEDQIKLKESVAKCLKNEEELTNLKINASNVYNIAKTAISGIESNVDIALLPSDNNTTEYYTKTIASGNIKKWDNDRNDSLFSQTRELLIRHEKYIQLQLIKRLYLISFSNAYKEYLYKKKVNNNYELIVIKEHLIAQTYFITTGKKHQNFKIINFDE